MFLLGFELFGAGERDQARTLLDQAARLSADDRHIKPFFDFYASLDELNSPPDANQPASSDKDVPIPDLLGEQPATRPKRS